MRFNFRYMATQWTFAAGILALLCFAGWGCEKKSASPQKKAFSYLAVGNSITWHRKCDSWWSEIGMAATEAEKDYVHLVVRALEKKHGNVTFKIQNFSQWEVMAHDRAEFLPMLDANLNVGLDLVTIQLGENVQDRTTLRQDFAELFRYIRQKAPQAQIVVIGDFWRRNCAEKRAAATECGVLYADLEPMFVRNDPAYACGLNTLVKGDDGKMHAVTHPGVAAHPGDKGMAAIADAVILALDAAK